MLNKNLRKVWIFFNHEVFLFLDLQYQDLENNTWYIHMQVSVVPSSTKVPENQPSVLVEYLIEDK